MNAAHRLHSGTKSHHSFFALYTGIVCFSAVNMFECENLGEKLRLTAYLATVCEVGGAHFLLTPSAAPTTTSLGSFTKGRN